MFVTSDRHLKKGPKLKTYKCSTFNTSGEKSTSKRLDINPLIKYLL